MFLARTKSRSSRASASVPVSVPSIVIALMANMAAAIEKLPPSSPVTTTLPPARQQAGRELQRLVRADEIADREQAAGCRHDRLARLRIGGIVGLRGAGGERGLRVCRHRCRRRLAARGTARVRSRGPSCPRRPVRSAAAGRARPVRMALERRIGRQPRTHQRSGEMPGRAARNRADSANAEPAHAWRIRRRPRCRDDDGWSTNSLRRPAAAHVPQPIQG